MFLLIVESLFIWQIGNFLKLLTSRRKNCDTFGFFVLRKFTIVSIVNKFSVMLFSDRMASSNHAVLDLGNEDLQFTTNDYKSNNVS